MKGMKSARRAAAQGARALTLSLFLLTTPAFAQTEIRVLLAEITGPVMVAMPGGHRGSLDGSSPFHTALALDWPLEAKEGRLWVDAQPTGKALTLYALDGEPLSWQGQPYRGGLEFVAEGEVLRVINLVDLEDYLRGVVPAEMHANWPLEALKAQAVAARSYVLASREEDLGYDVCATVMCQVYHGAAAEHPRADEAIAETRGLVLAFGGQPAKTHYHSHSGGYLASSAEVWGYSLPYLPGHADVASPPPHNYWEQRLDPGLMASSLQALGLRLGAIAAVQILDATPSGRAYRVRVTGDGGEVVLQGAALTSLLRSWGLKSTRFSMRSALVAQGGGYGHGVGMSQYGAYSLAQAGRSFEEILSFYYPGTELLPLGALLEAAGP